jgi:hypothetical protein
MTKKPDRFSQKTWGSIQQTADRLLDSRGGDISDIFRETFGMEEPAAAFVVFAMALRNLSLRLDQIETTLEEIGSSANGEKKF